MAERKVLTTVEYITDHSCGSYRIGEIDSLPDYDVIEYINRFDEYGYEQIRDYAIRMLISATTQIRLLRMQKHRPSQAEGETT